MANPLSTKQFETLNSISLGDKSLDSLTTIEAIKLAQDGFLTVSSNGTPQLSQKAERAVVRELKKAKQSRVTLALAYFLGSHMKPGVGYSVKPQGKSLDTSILPHVAKLGLDRDEVLDSLKSLRNEGVLETNAGHVKNNCSIRWFLTGTFEPDTGVAQNAEPKEEETVFAVNG